MPGDSSLVVVVVEVVVDTGVGNADALVLVPD